MAQGLLLALLLTLPPPPAAAWPCAAGGGAAAAQRGAGLQVRGGSARTGEPRSDAPPDAAPGARRALAAGAAAALVGLAASGARGSQAAGGGAHPCRACAAGARAAGTSSAPEMGAGASSIKGLSVQQVIELIAEYFHSRNFTVKSAFSFLDRDDSGSLVFEEFLRGFRLCTEGMGADDDYPPEVLKPIFSLFDINQDGNLSIEEFVQAFCPKTGYGTTYYDCEFYSRARQTPGSFSFISPATESSQMKEQRFRDELFMRVASAIKRLGYSNLKLFEEVDVNGSGDLTREEDMPDPTLPDWAAILEGPHRDPRGRGVGQAAGGLSVAAGGSSLPELLHASS
ncbi:unnamed protein product [Prorocentrum cordatum]|uniref:EF-hand domain-containing protein n=1 Tax=Prorocentrum cordatum TaxID=2364126 RepID=A0ABN9TSQ6_9DINO|nr:unnamed protein product [Polarella glacialis]